MMDGILNVYKEQGYTSHDVVAKMRGILRIKKIGHTGTLDPAAEGVLPVCIGAGTKLCDLLTDKTKTYRAVLLLGVTTDTQDTTGTVLSERPVTATEKEVRAAVMGFLGSYMQIPPMYSALKVNGKKLYELARAGKEVERQAREVVLSEICIEEIKLPRVTFTVSCSKGTYIRTLCHDIGECLGCGGCMEQLLRTRVGQFELKDSLRLSEVEKLRDAGELEQHLVTVDEVFAELPALVMRSGDGDKLVHNGNPFPKELAEMEDRRQPEQSEDEPQPESQPGSQTGEEAACEQEQPVYEAVRVYDSSHRFIGIYGYREEKDRYQPKKIFLGGS